MSGEWEQTTSPASVVTDDGTEIKFAVQRREVSSGNRLAKRARPYRDGVKLDHLGAREDSYVVDVIFVNTIDEPGLEVENQPLWPDRLEALIAVFRARKTMTLHLPWERNIRCKADNWRRTAATTMRDGEILQVTFVTDNEDALDPTAATISAKALLSKAVESAEFDADSEGSWDGSLADLKEFAADLEGIMNAPGDALSDIEAKAQIVSSAADSILHSASAPLLDPESNSLTRRLLEISDMSARSKTQARSTRRQVIVRTWNTVRDLFSIAAELRQPIADLLDLNSQLPDPTYIPPMTPVKVYA